MLGTPPAVLANIAKAIEIKAIEIKSIEPAKGIKPGAVAE
jgi:hypothetical protein